MTPEAQGLAEVVLVHPVRTRMVVETAAQVLYALDTYPPNDNPLAMEVLKALRVAFMDIDVVGQEVLKTAREVIALEDLFHDR